MRWPVASLAASALLIGAAGNAFAADMPVKAMPPPALAIYNWTGFYIGANVGGGWERGTGDLIATSGGIAIPTAVAGGTIPRNLNLSPSGVVGGGQAGYNWQINQIVFGLETDLQASGIRQSVTIFHPAVVAPPLFPTINTGLTSLDWFGTVRGRVGYAWNNFLLYGTGGFAYGGTTDSGTSQTVPPPPFGSGSVGATRTGWAAGAGFEWGFIGNWSVKGEYLHIDLGSSTVTDFFPASGDFLTYRYRHEYDIGRVGINYRFSPTPVVAKY
ncbi:outer membrane protein [Bradyrhizobium sp. NP1]|uniref:outer membrane protein n=1 Tax=Bradyrhizobium sp. NP1 TaxID=3049772 RepID=UPI0025A66570|nr:outer membrane protein [Bradyrhizobium sp. NP1]WJR78976.1 porin family protein [Bradyrhizobium sp. NP1]